MAGDLVEDQVAKAEVNGGGNEVGDSIEAAFEGKPVPKWGEQITIRAMVVSALLGVMFSVIVMKLNLTTGIIPSLNVAAGLLGFFFIKSYTKVLEKLGFLKQPFTRQENTVIQTCVVACYGIAFSGGFGSYLFGMSSKVANGEKEGNDPFNIKDPQLGWIIGFLFLVSFLGLFSIVPLRKIMIIDYKLTYPSGTATAYLINGFHTPEGAKLAKKQVGVLGRFFSFSFLWGFFQWFFAAGDGCGFSSFPTFGLKAYANRFYFDFSATYVGVGMICPYMVNISLLLGAILSWGIMWPSIISKSGDWYPSGTPARSLSGIQGYRVFIAIAFILGDGLYNFVKVTLRTIKTFMKQTKQEGSSIIPISGGEAPGISFDEHRRNDVFMRNGIKNLYAVTGYVILAIISIIVVPHIFPQLKWYHVLVTYIIAPVLAFCNAYGCGLTDWSLASTYGKLAIFIFGAWAGKDHGGILAGLASCGVMMSIVSTASDLMQDFKTGYLTLASPRSMFVSQVVGTAMGCIIAPSVFWLFYKAFDIGNPDGEYAAPFANLYRSIAILGVEGLSALPKNCLSLCLGFFIAAFLINLAKDLLPKKVSKFVPIPMAMAIPFYIGGYFAIDMCLGSLILFIWERKNKVQADQFGPAVASGLICGDGIWSLPTAFLSLAKIQAPVCMNFLSRTDYAKVTSLLNS